MDEVPFDPLARDSLAKSIVARLVANAPVPLGSIPRFSGAGIYAIYFTGDFAAYRVVRDRNIDDAWDLPLYVGKAVQKGGRQGLEEPQNSRNTAVWTRLRQHARSVEAVENLDIADFFARWLIVDDIWIALGESALIRQTRPVWNAVVDGFGNHAPGKGRSGGMKPLWDTLHPGRSWAMNLNPRPSVSAETVANDAARYLRERHED